MRHNHILLTVIFISTFFYQESTAQFNLKIAYNVGLTQPGIYNDIITQFNKNNDWLEKPMPELKIIHGLQLGFRYKIDNFALELSWHNKYGQRSASGILPGTDNDEFKRELNLRMNELSFAYESFLGPIGIGASIDGIIHGFKTKKTGIDDRYRIGDTQFAWGSHFFVGFHFDANDVMRVSFKPYVQIPWSKVNLGKIDEELNEGNTLSVGTDYKERFMNFGIMLIFYNGES